MGVAPQGSWRVAAESRASDPGGGRPTVGKQGRGESNAYGGIRYAESGLRKGQDLRHDHTSQNLPELHLSSVQGQ